MKYRDANADNTLALPTINESVKKPLVLFFHGFAPSPTGLCTLEEAFFQAGFGVHSPWLAGHPLEDCAPNKEHILSMAELRQSVLNSVTKIDHGKYDIYLVGSSLGGH